MAEQLQEAEGDVQVWLRNVLNAQVKLEEIPSTLKSGNIAVYKGSCKNPCRCYCGVTLSSVLVKILEMFGLNEGPVSGSWHTSHQPVCVLEEGILC